ncbi:MAG: transcriptional regulator [Lachnospiraceae bacterium]|nr:transcriptional regulator [Lachnospiraceae bacterium]
MSLGEELFLLRFSYESGCAKSLDATSTSGEDGVLLWLYMENRAAMAGELARALGLTSGRIANILKKLDEKEMISREMGTSDKRKVYISLTEKGRERIEAKKSEEIAQYNRVLEKLGDKDAREYLRITRRILELN